MYYVAGWEMLTKLVSTDLGTNKCEPS